MVWGRAPRPSAERSSATSLPRICADEHGFEIFFTTETRGHVGDMRSELVQSAVVDFAAVTDMDDDDYEPIVL
jgi:hypothetical protein